MIRISSRLKIFEISHDMLAEFIKTNKPTIVEFAGIPKDAKFVYSFNNDENRTLSLVYEHESFPYHVEGTYIEKGVVTVDTSDLIVQKFINTQWFKEKIRLANRRNDVTGNH